MLSGRQLHGLIVKSATGAELGRVADLVFDNIKGSLSGLIVSDSGILAKTWYLPLESVKEISLQGVITGKKKLLQPLPAHLKSLSAIGWRGCLVQDRYGQDKGSVTDVLLQGKELAGFEISDGLIGDFLHRRSFLPFAQTEYNDGIFQQK